MTLERVRDYALAGVDSISVGALTHSVAAADVSLEVEIG
jgi:nicotinate-nucleotide pyrophosphorylase (carboxylating)